MNRDGIALMARARTDTQAMRELGMRYLAGTGGFPRHERLGLEYLSHPSIRDTREVTRILCDHLPVGRLLELGLEARLRKSADEGSPLALIKLGVLLVGRDSVARAQPLIERAATLGEPSALRLLALWQALKTASETDLGRALFAIPDLGLGGLLVVMADQGARRGDLEVLARCIRLSLVDGVRPSAASVAAVRAWFALASRSATVGPGPSSTQIETCLASLADQGDSLATYWLGCGCAGIEVGGLRAEAIVGAANLRRGVALLVKAGDAGVVEAWLPLYRLHADPRSSVANPGLARFFLEKAALAGIVQAQRRFGAVLLKEASSIEATERAVGWLHTAAEAGDPLARELMATLVLPATGSEAQADAALDIVREADPWLAARLGLARRFGLTKLEALCLDPVQARRPWGMVVAANPFIGHPRMAAPRAIPALGPAAQRTLADCVALFASAGVRPPLMEAGYRRASARQRALFRRKKIDPALFFVKAGATQLDALRRGTRWAWLAAEPLKRALATEASAPDR